MHIQKLSLFNFKNYEDVALNFTEKVTCLVGANGSGKTNILDAVYYLSLTKSAFNAVDSQNIRFGEKLFSIKGTFVHEDKSHEVVCAFQEGVKKTFKVDRQEYDKLGEHVGRFPVVLIAPDDADVIREGSEARRKFFDTIICQLDRQYLENLTRYNQYLKQRNSALKKFSLTGKADHDLLQAYDQQLLPLAKQIYTRRAAFVQDFVVLFKKQYADLTDNKEKVTIDYSSALAEPDYIDRFKAAVSHDLALERTTMGVHRDDFKLLLSGKALKKFASQGQQKSYLVALKLAHFDIIKSLKGFMPVLLLDDIFDKLDDQRIKMLMQMISGHQFGQVFITDARRDRTEQLLTAFGVPAQVLPLPI